MALRFKASGQSADHGDEANMTVQGDLSTIHLADLLQNIQVHGRTGTLALCGDEGSAKLFFRDGNIALLAADGRAPFVQMLASSGLVSAKKLDAAQKKQRGTRRTVAEILVAGNAIDAETLRQAAEDFLAEDAANLVAAAKGEFQFHEHEAPNDGFDPDEQSLQLALPVAPLILEATRRVDHWVEIRKFLPSDSMHFQVRNGASCRGDVEDPELAAAILQALDGSRSVKEIADLFPNRRFLTYKLLADFVRDRLARPTSASDLLALAAHTEPLDRARARQLVQRGLDSEPHHVELLAAEARLAEALADYTAAAAACKLMAHLLMEAGNNDEGLQRLEQGKRLTPADPAIWERTLTLALTQGRRQDAVEEGLRLVELYRAPGLHSRVKEVLDRLLEVEPESVELHVEFARARVDCGEAAEAVKHLARRGKAFVGRENYLAARTLYDEILQIEPGNREATLSIEMIDKEIYARRRERKRRAIRLCINTLFAVVAGVLIWCEISARMAFVETRSLISREHMVETGQYRDAVALLRQLCKDHPLSLTARWDVPRWIADLELRLQDLPAGDPRRNR
jgi:tetratricopeptide (TPR) repeat protein